MPKMYYADRRAYNFTHKGEKLTALRFTVNEDGSGHADYLNASHFVVMRMEYDNIAAVMPEDAKEMMR